MMPVKNPLGRRSPAKLKYIIAEKQRRHDFATRKFWEVVKDLPEEPKARSRAITEAERWHAMAERSGDRVLEIHLPPKSAKLEIEHTVAVAREIVEARRRRAIEGTVEVVGTE